MYEKYIKCKVGVGELIPGGLVMIEKRRDVKWYAPWRRWQKRAYKYEARRTG